MITVSGRTLLAPSKIVIYILTEKDQNKWYPVFSLQSCYYLPRSYNKHFLYMFSRPMTSYAYLYYEVIATRTFQWPIYSDLEADQYVYPSSSSRKLFSGKDHRGWLAFQLYEGRYMLTCYCSSFRYCFSCFRYLLELVKAVVHRLMTIYTSEVL